MTDAPPNLRQRGWMLAALGEQDLLMPGDIPARSLATMRRRTWIQEEPGSTPGPARHSLTAEGRAALLTVAKLNALLGAESTGRIPSIVAWPTLESLLREGLAVRLTAHGEPGSAEAPAWISALGRRLAGLPAVDERPASELLTGALTELGIGASVERDEEGNSHVVHRSTGFEATFCQVLGPGLGNSASHPAWMHGGWCGFIDDGGDVAELLVRDLTGMDCAADSAGAARALAVLLAARSPEPAASNAAGASQ
ncbi:hypothetical protein [Streptomyces anulatus]|uniref:hypothetical protein n=1 Tax=Streptomyces anulatus TaxID=1892 RepID=UPI001C262699|nr:hypothetical protein [Streptomyces anulatus]